MVKGRLAQSGEEESDEQCCPLCMEEFDLTDRSFHPCRCGYQVCLWCFHNIRDKLGGLCPACRKPYDSSSFQQLDHDLLAAATADRRKKRDLQRLGKTHAKPASTADNHRDIAATDRSVLQNVRVMQRNLVYVTGLIPSIAKDEILRKKEHFGRFGRIVKIAINRKTGGTNYSAYVTFKRNNDAADCISHINDLIHEGKSTMRATFGTTKYCSFFLRHVVCNNSSCLYLHELARESECFTKEDLQHEVQMDEFEMDHHTSDTVADAHLKTEPAALITEKDICTRTVQYPEIVAKVPIVAPVATENVKSALSSEPPLGLCRMVSAATQYQEEYQQPSLPEVDYLLPGISALGLGKSDSSPFGWEANRNPSWSTGYGSAISPPSVSPPSTSPPDSPRSQFRVERQNVFRSLLPDIDVSFMPNRGLRSLDYNLFAGPVSNPAVTTTQTAIHAPIRPPVQLQRRVISQTGVSDGLGRPQPGQPLPPPWDSSVSPLDGRRCSAFPGYGYDSTGRAPFSDNVSRSPPPGLSARHELHDFQTATRLDNHPPGLGPRNMYHGPIFNSPPEYLSPMAIAANSSGRAPELNAFAPSDRLRPNDFQAVPSQFPPSVGTPRLIQRPSVEPVPHMSGARF
uniref:RING-type domain-containing protein n=1 Tax=Spongospora subterranea TaxID=70186 RepID=A0A0H5RA31_9EUKA|eukprot:CRZ10656.1 hypothetical protein [Spongospora subterranea]